MRWPDCAKHNGRHLDVHGQCVHHGAPVAIRPGVCPADGCRSEVMRVLDLRDGTVRMLEAGGDQEHRHAAPIRVELDAQQLADAIVTASRAARQDRQQEAAPATVATAPQPPKPRDDLGLISGVPVVRADDGPA